MDLCTLAARVEDSLHSIDDRSRRGAVTALRRIVLSAGITVAACSTTSGPSEPGDSQGPYLGTWTGTVASTVIGTGSATIVFDGGIKSPRAIQVNGRWSFVFADSRFSASGTVTGIQLPENTFFQLIFSSSTVPCPAEPDGVAQRGRSASLTLTANRMEGSYMDNGCPGGTIDLTRK